MEFITLNNGVQMPMVGYGVFQISDEDTEHCVLEAIKVGYRLIDTAQSYANETGVGNAIAKCGVDRTELFITTKVWLSNYGYEKAKISVLESMRKLQVEYLDLVLLHQPFGDVYGSYRALVELYQEGKLRAVGVSNFYPDRLTDIALFSDFKPQVNQIEVNPFNQQHFAQENMVKNDVQIEAWAPFAEGKNDIFNNPTLKAIGDRYQKSIAQVILRWLLQRKVVSLAKSIKRERMEENFNIFDFSLTQEDMDLINSIDRKESIFFNHQDPDTVERFAGWVKTRDV